MGIPTVDLSPFFRNGTDDDEAKNKVLDTIREACSEYGFFQVVNHGVPLELISRAMKLSKTFFSFPDQIKTKYSPGSGAPLPAGYNKQPDHSPDKNEYLLMFPPQSEFNILPTDPPGYRDALEEIFIHFVKTAQIIEQIVNDCLGLPPNFLKDFNQDRSWDFMVTMRYYPATESENNGITEHEDGNLITFVIQDEVGGLEVKKDGKWIPVIPAEGKIVVNISDIIQVLSNNKFKSATHRVVRSKERHRHSMVFFYSIHGDKWIQPLPQFVEEIGETSKYKGFVYKEYQAMRMKNKTHPPARPEDAVTLKYYAV